jgi:selT/selW/selH-like putative selenoprotein
LPETFARTKNAGLAFKSGGGVFEITVDGKLAYSKKATGRFPTDEEVLATLGS